MNIYVGNLSWTLKDQDLQDLFSQYGEISSAKIVLDKFTNRSKGFGFVEMANDDEAKTAIEALNGTDVGGRNIVVNESRPKEGGSSSGGGGFKKKSYGSGVRSCERAAREICSTRPPAKPCLAKTLIAALRMASRVAAAAASRTPARCGAATRLRAAAGIVCATATDRRRRARSRSRRASRCCPRRTPAPPAGPSARAASPGCRRSSRGRVRAPSRAGPAGG